MPCGSSIRSQKEPDDLITEMIVGYMTHRPHVGQSRHLGAQEEGGKGNVLDALEQNMGVYCE